MDKNNKTSYETTEAQFVADVRSTFAELQTEISQRNENIIERDEYIYGDKLKKALNIPIGHDFTPVNWLRRTVEIHKNMFMSRGFQLVSTYDTENTDDAEDENERRRLTVENDRKKAYAESRQQLIKSIIDDNGGYAFWATAAENASAVGDVAIQAYFDKDQDKYVLCQIESLENLYVLWNRDDFRSFDAVAHVYQVSRSMAISEYGAPQDVATSTLGKPLTDFAANNSTNYQSGQPMVTIMDVTGVIEGWKADKGRLAPCKPGEETPLNVTIVGDKVTKLISDPKKLPKYYILPNKRQRRRPWGVSDVSDAAININLTYVETLSDWRTVAAKVNFPKFKAFNFPLDAQIPKPESRKIQYLPLAEGQDIVELPQGDANGLDWGRQLEELKEQFVRETGLSRVLFDDPSVTLNSNQALLTSMKPTSDIAEAKKQLWEPIIRQIFEDALETIALNKPELADIAREDDNWTLKVMWPSVMQKEDPVYQSMLINRFNAGTMSLQTFLESQGESKEEIDRLRSELVDPITGAILGKQTQLIAQAIVNAATAELQAYYQATLPQPQADAQGTTQPGSGAQITTPGQNQPGQQPMSMPGSGATTASPGGAVANVSQNIGA